MRTTAGAAVYRPRPRPDAERVLVCLSYCGGGTAPFRKWADALPDDTELALICYPGRESRFNTPFARNWTDLRDDVVRAAVHCLADRPYVLFGHSMGSWVAFETAVHLERIGLAVPSALVVSGGVAPDRRREGPSTLPRSDDSEEVLVTWMRELGQLTPELAAVPDLVRIAVDVLRADITVSESYRFTPGSRVSMPLRVLYGTGDATPFAEVERHWRPLANGPFQAVELPGGHFYTPEVWSKLPQWCTLPVPGSPGGASGGRR
ncbi:MAG TPA: alpha/beta fold hydrolase [Streptomyces sp.]|nr:alpha/beta fold hydrolase [Streptomyces sp.]